jgi:N-formylglutamate amidohydrolase
MPSSGTRSRAAGRSGTTTRTPAASRPSTTAAPPTVSRGWSVRHDDPYAGGFTTQHYGRPADGVHVIQIELARRLYLDEGSLRRSAGFEAVRSWCRELVAHLGQAARAGVRARPPHGGPGEAPGP